MAGSVSDAVSRESSFERGSVRVYGIDSVRALAALSVVFAHIVGPKLPDLLAHTPLAATIIPNYAMYLFTGHPAVIAFFVISGFCIHYPYIQKPLPVLPFWAARWTRIMIPVLVAIVLAKIARLKGYNFWDGYILWSIVCELFYYTLYPLFLLLSRWVNWRIQFYLALLLSFGIVIGLGSDQYGNAHVYGPMLNWLVALPSWLAGCVLAESVHKQQNLHIIPSAYRVVFWRCLVAGVASVLYWATMNTRLGYYLTMNGFALLTCFWIRAEIVSPNNQEGVLEGVGKWTYSIYLLHMPVFLILGRILKPVWNDAIQLLCVPLVLYICFWFYKKVESPSHGYARRLFKTINPRGLFVLPPARFDLAAQSYAQPVRSA